MDDHKLPTRAYFAALLLTLPLTLASATSFSEQSVQTDRQITVSGSGSVTLEPSYATLTATVERHAQTASAAQDAVEQGVHQAVAALRTSGLADEAITAEHIRIEPRYRYVPQTNERLEDGFASSRKLLIKIDNIELLSAIIGALASAKVGSISPPEYASNETDTAYEQALTLALEQARSRATVLAQAAAGQLGPLISADTEHTPSMPVAGARLMAASPEANFYRTGPLTVSAVVRTVWTLEHTQ